MKKALFFLFSIFAAVLLLTGCASEANMNAQAIITAMSDYALTEEEAFYFTYQDIQKQVAEQIDQGAVLNFEIAVKVPDIASADILAMPVELPEGEVPDYNDAEKMEQAKASLNEIAREALTKYILDGKIEEFLHYTLKFTLSEDENGLKAEILPKEIAAVKQKFDWSFSRKVIDMCAASQDVQKIEGAAAFRKNLPTLFLGAEYAKDVRITVMTITDGGMFANISYPDPSLVFKLAADERLAVYAKLELFKNITSDLIYDPMKVKTEGISRLERNINTDAKSENFAAFIEELTQIKTEAFDYVADYVNENVVKKEKPRPESMIMSGTSSGQSVTISVSAGLSDRYIKFYKDSKTVISVYIRGGSKLKFRIPRGEYKILIGQGSKWYGAEFAFGPDGVYYDDGYYEFEGGYYYTWKFNQDATFGNISLDYFNDK